MKKIILLLTVLLGLSFAIKAQDDEIGKNLSLGFQLGQYQKDFGLGFNITSPYFADEKIAIRARGNIMWNEYINSSIETTWTAYSNVSLGIVGVGGEIGDFARLYGEGGFIVLFPSDEFSTESTEFGGYGLFGFEFFMNKYANYFIEIGGVGTGARADKVIANPIYSNGLLIQTGFRLQF